MKPRRVGVLLVNLGSPAATDYWSVRRYLKQFLSDPRVIEIWRPLWWAVLNLVVLSIRPQRSGHAYAQIWDKERNESPLVVITRRQAEKLAPRLAGEGIVVDWAMRYGEPAIGKRLATLRNAGCDRILIAPLYPQYAASTTATANDAAFAALGKCAGSRRCGRCPPITTTRPISTRWRNRWRRRSRLPFQPEVVLASFHGLPREYLDKGDPYHCQCQKTTRLLRETPRLAEGKTPDRLPVAVRPRRVAAALRRQDDCGTREERREAHRRHHAGLLRRLPGDAGGDRHPRPRRPSAKTAAKHFAAIPCLNDSAEGMALIETLVRRELSGWL